VLHPPLESKLAAGVSWCKMDPFLLSRAAILSRFTYRNTIQTSADQYSKNAMLFRDESSANVAGGSASGFRGKIDEAMKYPLPDMRRPTSTVG
jgi:hypothetical protein